MIRYGDVYRDRPVLVTGHTGFKGSWLALWLQMLGAKVTGVALSPDQTPNHWDLLGLDMPDHRVDIRDSAGLTRLVTQASPEIVFHLAAQSLVRRSYSEPLKTWSTNVMGTANLLEACRSTKSVRAIVIVTTDKCYENREWVWGYREVDRLGGHDPYSASKAATELVVDSYRKSFFNSIAFPLVATARAGNVIGGGDWSEDRLIPDLVRAASKGDSVEIRSPQSTRPWQHVLESLSGYLLLGQGLYEGKGGYADAWNFGPDSEGNRTVSDVLRGMKAEWSATTWHVTQQQQPHEATLLQLDCTKAHQRLAWRPVWSFDRALKATASWYRTHVESGAVISRQQIEGYSEDARAAGMVWCR